MLQRTWSVMQKEFIQDLRDHRTLFLLLLTPLLQLVLFGYAISMNVKHIPTVVADQSLDPSSRAYLDAMRSSGYFDIVSLEPDERALTQAMDTGLAHAGVIIPPQFAAHLARHDAQILFLVDGSDLFTSQSAYGAANRIAQQYAVKLLVDDVSRFGQTLDTDPVDVHIHILYNPDMKDLWFIIPGMIAMLLQTQTIVMTANAVVREREQGTIEQILVTPIRPIELMLGKIAPNILFAMFNMLTIMVVGVFWFGVPFQGSLGLFLLLSLVYVFCGLGLGLLISTISENQRQAQQLTMLFTLVGQVLGGFIFPRYTMPAIIRLVGNIFPLTYFIPISRGIINKGIGIEYVGGQVLALLLYTLVVMVFAVRAFRQRLE